MYLGRTVRNWISRRSTFFPFHSVLFWSSFFLSGRPTSFLPSFSPQKRGRSDFLSAAPLSPFPHPRRRRKTLFLLSFYFHFSPPPANVIWGDGERRWRMSHPLRYFLVHRSVVHNVDKRERQKCKTRSGFAKYFWFSL